METTLNFNLRKPYGKRATNIYAVINHQGTQYKIPTSLKIYPWEWDSKRQQPSSKAENAQEVCEIIFRLNFWFYERKVYICTNDNNLVEEFKDYINNEISTKKMANESNLRKSVTHTPKATTLLIKAWDIYKVQNNGTLSDGSIRVNEGYLKKFIEYCEAVGKDKMSMLKAQGISEYQNYLLRDGSLSNGQINKLCMWVVKMINKVLSCNVEFARYQKQDGIKKVEYNKLNEVSRKQDENIHQPLESEEVQAIENLQGLTPREEEVKDLFIMQINIGCRQSDLWRIFDQTAHSVQDGIIIYDTQKEDITAYTYINEVITALQEKYKNGFKTLVIDNPSDGNRYNSTLKKIAEKAGLTRAIKYKDAKGNTITRPLYEIISSHFARHTFAYTKLLEGYAENEVCNMTGHADDEMIKRIYGHIDKNIITKRLNKARARVEGQQQAQQVTAPQASASELLRIGKQQAEEEKIKEYKEVLAWMGISYDEYAHLKDSENLFRLIAKYEGKLLDKGYPSEKLKELFNKYAKEDYAKFRDVMSTL